LASGHSDLYQDEEPSTFLSPRYDPSEVSAVRFDVHVVAGPDSGRSLAIDAETPAPALVGKSPACALELRDREVSRRHVAFEISGERLRITDLGSTNGTTVDGVAIVDAYLHGAEVVRLGGTTLRVQRTTAATTPVLTTAGRFGRMLGASTEMRRLYPLCARVAAADVPVLIEGETGTGKEVLAESLHEQGARAPGPFVVFDCTAIPANLVEAELFGHERGAFTGAVASRRGVFEQAHGGTLLIDEIGDLDPALQPKLLRALERGEIRRVGGEKSIRVDVRVLCATRRDLDGEVQRGRFRDDLFHRFAVARIELPPLRKRRGDVPLLARHFAQHIGGDARALPGDLLARWDEQPWPGNVRELRNAVARRLALGDLGAEGGGAAPPAEPHALGELFEAVFAQNLPLVAARQRVIDAFERDYIARMLDRHGGNVSRAAEAAGVARRHFQRLRARGR
jgi:DNA-binding NtrC family response regulator